MSSAPRKRKVNIPKSLRRVVWEREFGKAYSAKCPIKWCTTIIDVWTAHYGHGVPECKEGKTVAENLRPICAACNLSMGSQYTIDQFSAVWSAVVSSVPPGGPPAGVTETPPTSCSCIIL